MSTAKHTPGPWKWRWSPNSKRFVLEGGVPKFDVIVMDFVRYGFNGAAPRFNAEIRQYLNVMKRADEFALVEPGREHHGDWHRTLSHPDADLIAAAPKLLSALKLCRTELSLIVETVGLRGGLYEAALKAAREAIVQAEGVDA